MDSSNRLALIKVAKLYYYGNLSQEQIAKLMGVSRPKISRMLSMARATNIVEISISESPLLIEQMAEKLRSHFGLRHVGIVPASPTAAQTKTAAGALAGEYLDGILRDGMSIGAAWGTSVDATIRELNPSRTFSNINVVQLVGGLSTPSFNIDSREMTLSLAHKLRASYSLLQAPMLVSSGQVREMLLSEPEFIAHYRLFDTLDVALVGLGSSIPEETVPYKARYLTLEMCRQLNAEGLSTDVCGSRIYIDGSIRHNLITDRLIGISPETIRNVPEVIGVAVGEDKAISIATAAKGGFIKTLITDEVAAISVIEAEGL